MSRRTRAFGVPGFSSSRIAAPSRCMWPAATWIVVGAVMRRSHVEIVLGLGLAALPRHRMSSPAGTNAAPEPYFRESSNSASLRLQSRPCSPDAHASSTGAGQEHRLERGQLRGRGRDGQKRARSIGRPTVQEVVVNLHHDLASRRQRNAGSVRQTVAAPAGCPGRDPARVVERVDERADAVAGGEPGSAEARPTWARAPSRRAASPPQLAWAGRGRGSRGARPSADPGRSGRT